MKIFLSVVCLLCGLESFSQDTLSIEQFDSIVIQHHNKMNEILDSKDTLSVLEAMNLIRIENTLLFGIEHFIGTKEFIARKQKYISFDSCFKIHFIGKVINKVEATIGSRWMYYSKKYDIQLGGTIEDPKNRYYIYPLFRIEK